MHTTQHPTLDQRRRGWIVAALAAALATGSGGPMAFASSAFPASPARILATIQIAQTGGDDESPPPSDQVEKYIAVYTAMQHNHSLTVDQAARKQGLTVAQFRSLEDRIQRNPVVHDRVLQALKAASKAKKPAAKTTP